ncbi:MAG: hydroxylamine oxidoreductase, partial [Planctomycetia bacterium]|nr:hydroxylamine oxidoreductase [Planctomycetia bacterium]
MPRYIWVPLIIALISVPAGFIYVNWNKGGEGAGLYSRQWLPEAIFAYWNPKYFYQSVDTIIGEFSGEQCIECHRAITPGIVNDWKKSRHSQVSEKVFCNSCHGSNHEQLHMPTPDICGRCHTAQHEQFVDEKRFGFPSHALAMERALDAKHFVDKPKAEVTACLQCHSVATKCDSCHTRHKFSAAEARRPEACLTCHSGPPHPDDETYFHSRHGQLYLSEGKTWDWSK